MKTYKCECGKEFTDPHKCTGHKNICKIHLGENYDRIIEIRRQNAIRTNKILVEKSKIRKEQELEQWIKEKHKCQTCGKIMTVKIRNGKYCSKSCAAAHGRVKKPKHLEGNLMNHIYNKHPEYGSKEEQLIRIPGKQYRNKGTLDITEKELQEYKESHIKCEICGRTLKEIIEKNPKSRGFCIDHDHETNKFRGLLCNGCNRHLGWYDKHKINVDKYISKNKVE